MRSSRATTFPRHSGRQSSTNRPALAPKPRSPSDSRRGGGAEKRNRSAEVIGITTMQSRDGYAMIARVPNPPSEEFHGTPALDRRSRSESLRVREHSRTGDAAAAAARGAAG